MFNKSRKKIVLTIMIITLLFLVIILGAIYISSYVSLKKQSLKRLDIYMECYSPDTSFDELTREFVGTGQDTTPSFYSVAFSKDRSVLNTDIGWSGAYTEEEVTGYALEILDKGKSKGSFKHMLYRREDRGSYILVAFINDVLMDESLGKMLVNTLVIGVISVIPVFVAAVILARRIIQPLEESDRRQKQFVSDAGHELKTPISVISTNAELLARQLGNDQWLSNIQYENERMGNLVKELLALTRVGREAPVAEDIDLSKLVQQEVLTFESIAFENGYKLISDIAEEIRVKGNRTQLGQIISIMVDNAISYGREGKEIVVSLKKVHRTAVISVENVGPEIPEVLKERLFDRFYRVDEARDAQGGHFGLGLPIAKAIVEAHKGRICVDCREGKVIFSVVLPLEK